MIKLSIHHLLIVSLILNFFIGCSRVRESAGVTRKSPDEFQVVNNPPLVIPPNYKLVPPDQLQEKNIENIEKELAQEILFGLEEKNNTEENQLSTMNKILSKVNKGDTSDTIREEIDEDFAKEIVTKDGSFFKWKDEKEVLDAIEESERIREKNFDNESIAEGDVPIIKQKVKKKKKKRFFIF